MNVTRLLLPGLLCLCLAGPALADGELTRPLRQLQRQGRLLSLSYDAPAQVYRVRLLSAQGRVLRYRLDARSGRISPDQRPDGPEDKPLIALQTLLERVFGQRPVRLLEAELEIRRHLPVYELEWLSQGRVLRAYYDAHTGRRLEEP